MYSMGGRVPNNDVCRLCDRNEEKMYSIFAKPDKGPQILHIIKECLPLIIYRTDPLSKKICGECFDKLETFYNFKKSSLSTANKQKESLLNEDANGSRIQLFLSCNNAETQNEIQPPSIAQKCNKGTSTNDLAISCINCKSTCYDSSVINNEVELCAELQQAIADSLTNNKVISSESEKVSRTSRRRSQAFYHELDDSLCSSLTEFTNTESSQCYDEYHSDADTYDSDSEGLRRVKRRKLNDGSVLNISERKKERERQARDLEKCKERYQNQVESRYFPLSLMSLALNIVNKRIAPDHEPFEFYIKTIEPSCSYCNKKFKNARLLAIHEIEHIGIEMGEKVDSPTLWHESRDNAIVRNKWLSRYDEGEYDESDEEDKNNDSLLIPVSAEIPQELTPTGEIVLIKGNPTVNGLHLHEYSKEERKAFYKTMKIGGVNKKFCYLCRYSFKDNWAIESHYFSLACYYTCRYCGMRFNKQRHRFEDHVQEHQDNGDPLSTKIYAASKLNNFVPRILHSDKNRKIPIPETPQNEKVATIKVKNFQRKSDIPTVKIKKEKLDSDDEKPPILQKSSPSTRKSANQAYFCRKCYKVFFKLDEFNIHSKNCDYNQFPQSRYAANKVSPKANTNGEMTSPTGRPMRHCVRETGTYKDEVTAPEPAAKERNQNQQNFVCFICNTPFPTIYSRNSHMRIHKNDTNPVTKPPLSTRQRPSLNSNNAKPYIKQEPLEPEVEIHESDQSYSSGNSIGTVSITPISKNPNQKPTINPNIMKLVQNNPHLTIKANRSPERMTDSGPCASHMQNNIADDKTYKCSSCWESFNNKSHLYFHKKNQCEGSKYPCPFCKKRFGTEAAYSSHIFYSHPE